MAAHIVGWRGESKPAGELPEFLFNPLRKSQRALYTDAMLPAPPLQRAIDRCYEVFAAYPEPAILHAAPTQDAVKILADLTSAPLRELDHQHIGPYASSALYTIGDVEDYKHFLPRILEWAVDGSGSWDSIDPEVVAGKLNYGKWLKWLSPEQAAIRRLYLEAFRQIIDEPPKPVGAEDWLCGIAILGVDVTDALEIWRSNTSMNATLHLAGPLWHAADVIFEGKIYWSKASQNALQLVRNWLLGDDISLRLHAIRGQAPESEIASVEVAIEKWQELKASCGQ